MRNRLDQFEAAVAAGHLTWLTYTVILTRITPLTMSDHETQQLVARHLAALKKWFGRHGEAFEAGWVIERRSGKLGLHAHFVIACPRSIATEARAAVVSSLSKLTGAPVTCPALKFHCRRAGVASAAQAHGWWSYCLKSAVRDGDIIEGIRGELHRPVHCKPHGWVHGAR